MRSVNTRNSRMLNKRMLIAHACANFLRNKYKTPGLGRVRNRLARTISKIFLPNSYGRIQCPTMYGFDLMLEHGTSSEIFRFGFYEPGTLDIMRRILRKGDVFVDAGASVGLMSIFASRQVGGAGRVLSFEPLPLRHELLSESIKLNRCSSVKAMNFGLGVKAEQTTIYTDRISPSMVKQSVSSQGIESRVERLDNVLSSENVKSVRMIKVDVEGYELDVLKGCESLLRSESRPAICVEYGVYDRTSANLAEFLRSLTGYNFYQLRKGAAYVSELVKIGISQKFRANDNIFCIPTGMTLDK